ncbi:MAG: hypothetical protein HC899_12545 [Leptolyngbyaceae cyanobacterium SM1_4_3]|nr:hypothetical protein [Leptolyngbyaceae cyanobacterium SM1_4_3]
MIICWAVVQPVHDRSSQTITIAPFASPFSQISDRSSNLLIDDRPPFPSIALQFISLAEAIAPCEQTAIDRCLIG